MLAIIDMYPSVVTIAASGAAERLKIPYYACISAATEITTRGFKYVFQQDPIVKEMSRNFVDFSILLISYLCRWISISIESRKRE